MSDEFEDMRAVALQADRVMALADVISETIQGSPLATDISTILMALGAVAGTVAKESGDQVEAMDAVNVIAQGVLDGTIRVCDDG